jgi:flagellar biosynthesis/type III secretory pathway ATPase
MGRTAELRANVVVAPLIGTRGRQIRSIRGKTSGATLMYAGPML